MKIFIDMQVFLLFFSLMNSVVTMTWASFNMIELTSLSGFDNTNMIQFWSAALFTVYHTSTMIVLLNMLIAMMANSYQQIEVMHVFCLWRCVN